MAITLYGRVMAADREAKWVKVGISKNGKAAPVADAFGYYLRVGGKFLNLETTDVQLALTALKRKELELLNVPSKSEGTQMPASIQIVAPSAPQTAPDSGLTLQQARDKYFADLRKVGKDQGDKILEKLERAGKSTRVVAIRRR